MSPDDSLAPEWAGYKAMDRGGVWWWYELKPVRWGDEWANVSGSRIMRVQEDVFFGTDGLYWYETLFEVGA